MIIQLGYAPHPILVHIYYTYHDNILTQNKFI
jgi:hypothetical protein